MRGKDRNRTRRPSWLARRGAPPLPNMQAYRRALRGGCRWRAAMKGICGDFGWASNLDCTLVIVVPI